MNEISGERAERGRRFADSSRFMKLIGQIKRGLETPLTDQIGSSVVVVVQLQIKQLLSRSGASTTTPGSQTWGWWSCWCKTSQGHCPVAAAGTAAGLLCPVRRAGTSDSGLQTLLDKPWCVLSWCVKRWGATGERNARWCSHVNHVAPVRWGQPLEEWPHLLREGWGHEGQELALLKLF